MNLKNIKVNQESSVCATLPYPRIHTAMSCKNLPPASGDFCDSWLTIIFTHFIYRLIHCGQNTVVSLMESIQQWIFLSKLTGKNLREINKRSCLAMSNQNLDENAINAKQRKITYSLQGEGTNFIRKLGNYKILLPAKPTIFFLGKNLKIDIPIPCPKCGPTTIQYNSKVKQFQILIN